MTEGERGKERIKVKVKRTRICASEEKRDLRDRAAHGTVQLALERLERAVIERSQIERTERASQGRSVGQSRIQRRHLGLSVTTDSDGLAGETTQSVAHLDSRSIRPESNCIV
jgi:hypothetical protein